MVRIAVAGFIIALAGVTLATPVAVTGATNPNEPDPDFFTTVDLNGVEFTNKVRQGSGRVWFAVISYQLYDFSLGPCCIRSHPF